MKKAVLFIAVLLCFNIKAQEVSKRFELGSTLITVNSANYYDPEYYSRFEFMNMLFFRYKLNSRFSLRTSAGYSEYNSYLFNEGSVRSSSKDFRIGGGAQFYFFKTNEFLYAFADVSYRNIFSKGYSYSDYGGSEHNFAETTNSCDSYLGLGSKIQLCKSVFLSPEIFLCINHAQVKGSWYPVYSGPARPYLHEYTQSHAGARLHLTVKF